MSLDNSRNEIVENIGYYINEMDYNYEMCQSNPILYIITTNDVLEMHKKFAYLIGFLINIFCLVTLKLNNNVLPDPGERKLDSDTYLIYINIISFVFAFYCLLMFLAWLWKKSPIQYKLAKEKYMEEKASEIEENSKFSLWTKFFDIWYWRTFLNSKFAINFVVHIIAAILGPLIDPFFHTLHVLLLVNISMDAMYILRAASKKFKTLFFTFVMAILLVYSYSVLAANYYSNKFDSTDIGEIDVCNTLASCFFYTANLGLRNGGGLADSMEPYEYGLESKFGAKFIFDLSYFMIINVICLNIVFGVIIDTFGEMRDEAWERAEKLENNCMICLLEKSQLSSDQMNFKDHQHEDHDIWLYIYYIKFLQEKDHLDYTNTEIYVM